MSETGEAFSQFLDERPVVSVIGSSSTLIENKTPDAGFIPMTKTEKEAFFSRVFSKEREGLYHFALFEGHFCLKHAVSFKPYSDTQGRLYVLKKHELDHYLSGHPTTLKTHSLAFLEIIHLLHTDHQQQLTVAMAASVPEKFSIQAPQPKAPSQAQKSKKQVKPASIPSDSFKAKLTQVINLDVFVTNPAEAVAKLMDPDTSSWIVALATDAFKGEPHAPFMRMAAFCHVTHFLYTQFSLSDSENLVYTRPQEIELMTNLSGYFVGQMLNSLNIILYSKSSISEHFKQYASLFDFSGALIAATMERLPKDSPENSILKDLGTLNAMIKNPLFRGKVAYTMLSPEPPSLHTEAERFDYLRQISYLIPELLVRKLYLDLLRNSEFSFDDSFLYIDQTLKPIAMTVANHYPGIDSTSFVTEFTPPIQTMRRFCEFMKGLYALEAQWISNTLLFHSKKGKPLPKGQFEYSRQVHKHFNENASQLVESFENLKNLVTTYLAEDPEPPQVNKVRIIDSQILILAGGLFLGGLAFACLGIYSDMSKQGEN